MRQASFMAALLCGVLVAPLTVMGHHGYSAFDKNKEVTFDATVVVFHFTNPHSVIEFEAKTGGEVRKWEAELGSRIQLSQHGWKATTIEPGTKLTISGYPAKNGSPSIWATKILDSGGKEIKITREN
jgi:hypothetical protein